jgi:hypothetical protein
MPRSPIQVASSSRSNRLTKQFVQEVKVFEAKKHLGLSVLNCMVSFGHGKWKTLVRLTFGRFN